MQFGFRFIFKCHFGSANIVVGIKAYIFLLFLFFTRHGPYVDIRGFNVANM